MDIVAIAALAPVIPVLTIDRPADAVPLAKALVKGGLPVLEVTFRTAGALEALQAMATVPGAVVGAGTVLNADQAQQARQAGARFLVSPGCTPGLIQAARAAATSGPVGISRASGWLPNRLRCRASRAIVRGCARATVIRSFARASG